MVRFAIRDLLIVMTGSALGVWVLLGVRSCFGAPIWSLFVIGWFIPCVGIGFLLNRTRGAIGGTFIAVILAFLTVAAVSAWYVDRP